MWQNIDGVFNQINLFNLRYAKQQIIYTDALTEHIKKLYESGMSDTLYWRHTNVNFPLFCKLAENIQEKEREKDFVSVYDIVNFELWKEIKYVAGVFFDRNIEELTAYFWNINSETLKQDYPMIVQHMENIQIEDVNESSRSYGIRGRVVYRKKTDIEYDLYSGYNPVELGIRTEEIFDLKKYSKIYMWGYNGGFELNGIYITECVADIEVYVTDLKEFKLILSNTLRMGVILPANIEYRFNVELKEFIENFNLCDKENSFIYVCEDYGDNLMLRQFIEDNHINSNIGVTV